MRFITNDIISEKEMSKMINDYKKLVMCNNSLYNLTQIQQTNETLNTIRCIIDEFINKPDEIPVYNLRVSLLAMSEIIRDCLKKGLITEDYIRDIVGKIIVHQKYMKG